MKNPKTFRLLNYILSVMLFLACVGLLIYYIVVGDPMKRASSCVFCAIGVGVPYILELVLKRKLSNTMLILYWVYIVCAAFVGSAVGVYKMNTWYDKLVHFAFGYIFNYIGIIITTRFVSKDKNPWFVLFVCISFTLAVAGIWEIIEYSCDVLVGATMQGPHVSGNTPLVTDTMLDIVAAFIGCILFCIQYFVHIKTRKNLLIDYTINDWEFNSPKIMKLAKDAQTDTQSLE